MQLKSIFFIVFTFCCVSAFSIHCEWTGTTSTDWGTATNWINVATGLAPASPPGASDDVTIVTGSNICRLNADRTVTNFTISSGNIEHGDGGVTGYNLSITGNALFSGGAVASSFGAAANITITDAGNINTATFSGTSGWNSLTINVTCANIYIANTSFQEGPFSIGSTCIFTKTGNADNICVGNNLFNITTLTNTGSGTWTFGGTTGDKFSRANIFKNTGSGKLSLAYAGVNSFTTAPSSITLESTGSSKGIFFGEGGGSIKTRTVCAISISSNGFTTGTLSIANFTHGGASAQSFTLTGTASLALTSCTFPGSFTACAPTIKLTSNNFNGVGATLNFIKTGSTADDCTGGNTFTGTTTITNNGTGDFTMANTTGDLFSADVTFNVGSSGSLYPAFNGSNNFDGNIVINETGTGQFYLGNGVGTSTLAAGKTISIGAGGFISGSFGITGLTQLGATSQALIFTSITPSVNILNCNFNGALTLKAGAIRCYNNTFNGTVDITKTAGTLVNGWGGNTFNQAAVITMSTNAGGGIYTGTTTADTYNGDVTFTNRSNANFNLGLKGTNNFNGNITFNSTGNGGIFFGQGTGTAVLANTKTIITNTFTSGSLTLKNFTQTGTTVQSFTLGSSATLRLGSSTTFNGNINIESGSIYLNGTTFNGTANFKHTGGSGLGTGGNIFRDALTINATGGTMYLAQTTADTYTTTVTVVGSSSGGVYFSYGAAGNNFYGNIVLSHTGTGAVTFGSSGGTCTLASGKTIAVGASGFSGSLYLLGFTQTSATAQTFTVSGSTGAIYIGPSSSFGGNVIFKAPNIRLNGCTYNGTATFEETIGTYGPSNGGNIFYSTFTFTESGPTGFALMGSTAGDTYHGDATFNNNGVNSYIDFGGGVGVFTFSGTATFNNSAVGTGFDLGYGVGDTWIFNNTATFSNLGAGGYFYLADPMTFNGDVVFNSITSDDNLIYFDVYGVSNISTLADGKKIKIGATGFSAGQLALNSFSQVGTTAQSFTLTGTGSCLSLSSSTFAADVNFTAPRIGTLYSNIFNGVATLQKTGAGDDNSSCLNVFNGATTFKNSGSGIFYQGYSLGDDFNGDATFIQTGSGALIPGYYGTSTFAKNISTVGTNSVIVFGVPGWVAFDGTGAQAINGDASLPPVFNRITLAKTVGTNVTLNVPITMTSNNLPILTLTSGNIITTSTNILTISDELSVCTVSGASNNSYVDGPIKKVANRAFTFPVGKGGYYRPISITAPSVNTDAFTAEYFRADPNTQGNINSKDVTLDHLDRCEYWILNRTTGVSTVSVTLSWNSAATPTCSVTDLPTLRVARWDGSTWKDHGNASTTGNASAGTIRSNVITSFSPFTLASSSAATNPLPIELLEFTATSTEQKQVYLNWKTASEINNDYFTIEKTQDGQEFEFVTTIDGAGNSTEMLSYNSIDVNPYEGISYYRLKQTDFDGKYTYSDLRAVNITHNNSEFQISIYPNPSKNNDLNLFIDGEQGLEILIVLHDVLGKNYYTKAIVTEDKKLVLKVTDELNLSPGIYNITASSNNIIINKKVVVE